MTDPSINLTETDEDTSLLDSLLILAKHKRLILGLPFLVALITAGISLMMPNVYTATTKILPPQQSQSAASAMLAQLGNVAGLVGGTAGLKNQNDVYVAMLKSRTIADKIIQRFGLVKLWKIDSAHPSDANKVLAGVTKITSGKDGTVTVEVDDKDAKTAADLANAYIDELMQFSSVLAVTEASQRRLFFEGQVVLAKDNLAKSEAAARQALQTGGLIKVDAQGRAILEVTARLRGQITVKEVQIGAMRTFAADGNPELRLAQEELASLKRELAKIEGSGDRKAAASNPSEQGSDSLHLLRDVKYNEVLLEVLSRQYELAKIDEAKDSSVVQIMDKAIEPDRKSKPKRAILTLSFALAAFFLCIIWAFICEYLAKAKSDPRQANRLLDLKHHLAWKQK